jgi:hypothetical protein
MMITLNLYDQNDVPVESVNLTPEQASRRAAEFVLLHGADPAEGGEAAAAGKIEFHPVTAKELRKKPPSGNYVYPFPTKVQVVDGEILAEAKVRRLIAESRWFEVMPLPDDQWRFTVKAE